MTLTNFLVAINVVVFIWQISTGAGIAENNYTGTLVGVYVLDRGEWYRVVTSAFMHANLAHIGLNMIALLQVGNIVEQLYGKARFALVYALAIVGSGLAIVYFTPNQATLGASGAIFGLFGALVAVGIRMGSRGRSLIGQVIPVLAINLVFTFTVPGISAAAHVGGLLSGFIAGLVLYMVPSRRRAYAYAYAPGGDPGAETIEQTPEVETIEQPPDAGAHEEEGAPPPHLRDPRE